MVLLYTIHMKKTEVDIRNFTRRAAPVFPYLKAAEEILPGWEISLVFSGTKRAQNLNMQLRKKSYIPNVLSYETGSKSGEIIICLEVAKKQAQSYGVSYTQFVGFLFIHGLLHLKGLPHGTTMERYEQKYLERFAGVRVSYDFLTHGTTTNRNRN
jgi:probable rRNA maturation factor